MKKRVINEDCESRGLLEKGYILLESDIQIKYYFFCFCFSNL